MSLSKNIKHYRRCVPIRHYTGGSNTVERPKMTSRTMSLTQWKVLSSLKDYLSKISIDKTFQSAMNKEWAHILQRIQPRVYGNELVRYFDSATVDASDVKKSDTQSSISNVINGFKLKIGNKEEVMPPKQMVPKWKTEAPSVSKSSIISRTRHIINSIMVAETDESRLKRIEELSTHIQQYPEAKNSAVKEGAIRVLLHVRRATKNSEILGAINEVFALSGYTQPLPMKGIRILSIDGGGIRGILVIEMLKKLEELTGKKVYEMFDFICGVSTGAILCCSFALRKSCEQLAKDYVEISTEIFTQSTIKGTSNLVWSHAYYNTELWEKLLKQQLTEDTLISTSRMPVCPKIANVSAVVNHERLSAYVFRNYSLPWRVQSQYMGDNTHKLWESARASAAAPTIFEECKLGNLLLQDGGILVNNPTAVAIHEAKLLWPNSEIQCVVSFGTGRTVPNPMDNSPTQAVNALSWRSKFMKMLESATDTEGVHTMLSDLLPENVYFRFNPYLTEMLSMTEINRQKLEILERDAVMYLRRNEDKFQQAAKALMQPRTYMQKVGDYIKLQQELLGFTSKL